MNVREAGNSLDFTLAPVQGFVGQARRTRDFWAGSYLLSYLSAHAMNAVQRAGGSVVFPFVENDPLMLAVSGAAIPSSRRDNGARIASLPNRFSAECPDPVQCGKLAAEAVNTQWHRLALMVWREVRAKLLQNLQHRELLPELANADALPATWERQITNHWETYWVAGAGEAGIDQRKNWRHMHLFSEQGEVCTVCGERVVCFGEGLPRWQARRLWYSGGGGDIVDCLNNRGDRWDLALDEEGAERLCAVCMVKRVFPYVAKSVIGWDVQVSFPSTHDLAGKPSNPDLADSDMPYYAVLVMDGDNMGRTLGEHREHRRDISQAIAAFSQEAPKIIEGYGGVPVYSGGDDVLALLPVKSAIPCAAKLRQMFVNSCSFDDIQMRISAAIMCTHVKSPMQAALRTAHRLLDGVAKERLGRDGLAIQVNKRSGSPLMLAKPWGRVIEAVGQSEGRVDDRLTRLSERVFSSGDHAYSSKFLYNIAELLEPFATTPGKGPDLASIDVVPILAAEYLRGPGALKGYSWNKAVEMMSELYDVCRWHTNPGGKADARALQPEAFPLIRFFAEAREVTKA